MIKLIHINYFSVIFAITGMLMSHPGFAQGYDGSTLVNSGFYGNATGSADVCTSASAMTDDEAVINMVDGMCQKMGLNNGFIIKGCHGVPNCQALMWQNKPCILYNAEYLRHVKEYSFIEATLPKIGTGGDWQALTVLAHELGHHFNNHLTNPKPGATCFSIELEADHFAGHMIHLLGGTLAQAQAVYNTLPEKATYTHPAGAERLKAVEAGWREVGGEVKGNTNVFAEKLLTKLSPHDDSLILDAANECLIKLTESIENLTTQENGIPKNVQRQRKDQIVKDLIDMFSSPKDEKCVQLKMNNNIFWRSAETYFHNLKVNTIVEIRVLNVLPVTNHNLIYDSIIDKWYIYARVTFQCNILSPTQNKHSDGKYTISSMPNTSSYHDVTNKIVKMEVLPSSIAEFPWIVKIVNISLAE